MPNGDLSGGLSAGAMGRARWASQLLPFIAVAQLLACERQRHVEQNPPGLRPSSTSSAPVVAPAVQTWLKRVPRLLEDQRGRDAQPDLAIFARVRFELPRLSPQFVEGHCPTASDCRTRTRYVRLQRVGDRLQFLADCSALDAEHLLDELAQIEPFRLLNGKLAAGQRLQLVGKQGQRLGAELQFFAREGGAAKGIVDDYLYARSVSVAFAQSRGISVPLLGKRTCSPGLNTSVCEADLATQGSPLAALQALGSPPPGVSPEQWLRQRTLVPVSIGFFQNFCGRAPLGPWSAPTEQDAAYARARARELIAAGLELDRLLRGAAWTALGERVPQVDMRALRWMLRTLDQGASLEPQFQRISVDSSVSWRNRLRARYLTLPAPAASSESELLREFRELLPRCSPSRPGAPCAAAPEDDQLDLTCIAYTLGIPDLLCSSG
jgi:hypothetical protein